MFERMQSIWAETALTSAIEGIIREFNKGNIVQVQRWYFKLKKEIYKQAMSEGKTPEEIEELALGKINTETADAYDNIVNKLSRPGQALEEINEWLRHNNPDI